MDKRFRHFSNSGGDGNAADHYRQRQALRATVACGEFALKIATQHPPRKQGVIRGAVHTVETFGCAATLDASAIARGNIVSLPERLSA